MNKERTILNLFNTFIGKNIKIIKKHLSTGFADSFLINDVRNFRIFLRRDIEQRDEMGYIKYFPSPYWFKGIEIISDNNTLTLFEESPNIFDDIKFSVDENLNTINITGNMPFSYLLFVDTF